MDETEKIFLILAGGLGSRLWPISSRKKPKQFLKVKAENDSNSEDEEMIIKSIKRTIGLPNSKTYVVTNRAQSSKIKRLLYKKNIKNVGIIKEKLSIGTLNSFLEALKVIGIKHKESAVIFMPSDQILSSDDIFRDEIEKAVNIVKKNRSLILFGTKIKTLEERFGYILVDKKNIKSSKDNEDNESSLVYTAKKFYEKPSIDELIDLIDRYEVYVNMGVIVGLTSDIKEITEKYLDKKYDNVSLRKGKSVDKALLEKVSSNRLEVLKSNVDFKDIGTFESIMEVSGACNDSNVIITSSDYVDKYNDKQVEISNVKHSLIYDTRKANKKTKIVVKDVENLILAASDEGMLIRRSESSKKE